MVWSRGLLKQQMGTGTPGGLQPSWSRKQNPGVGVVQEAMEKDFQLASRKFWKTVRRLRRGNQGLAQAVFSSGGELLTLTGYIVERWKEHVLCGRGRV